jgi:flagellar motor switch protein FliN/FliY
MEVCHFWSLFCISWVRMATIPTLPAPANVPTPDEVELAAEQALVPSPLEPEEGDFIQLNGALARLPVQLDVMVPVREFRVRNLLALEPGQVVETEWGHGEDMPLSSGKVQLAWSEFEVVDTQLAVRVTRLA